MAERTVEAPVAPPTQEVATRPEETRTSERYVTPPVDIYEMPEGLVVTADVPGITPDHLDIHVGNHVLTIRAQADDAQAADSMYREYERISYFRQFELNEEVDESGIRADLKHGVLTLTLPKSEKAKPRKITVATS